MPSRWTLAGVLRSGSMARLLQGWEHRSTPEAQGYGQMTLTECKPKLCRMPGKKALARDSHKKPTLPPPPPLPPPLPKKNDWEKLPCLHPFCSLALVSGNASTWPASALIFRSGAVPWRSPSPNYWINNSLRVVSCNDWGLLT